MESVNDFVSVGCACLRDGHAGHAGHAVDAPGSDKVLVADIEKLSIFKILNEMSLCVQHWLSICEGRRT